jgi:Holliday junction resolvase
MAQTPEGKVKTKVKEILATMGAYYVMPTTGGFGNSGIPDILCCINGKFIGIECKAKGGKVTRLQQSHLDEIQLRGGIALVVDEGVLPHLKLLLQDAVK